jgi:hypothetical protein
MGEGMGSIGKYVVPHDLVAAGYLMMVEVMTMLHQIATKPLIISIPELILATLKT